MALTANVRESADGKVRIADLRGRITLGEGAAQLRELIHGELAQGHRSLLLNMAGVAYMDSSGLGELLSGRSAVSSQGGALKLLNLSKKVRDLLQITRLSGAFDVHDDETKALESFSAGRSPI